MESPVKLKQIAADVKPDVEQLFSKDLEVLHSTISLMNNRIQLMKNKINLINENIISLYTNFMEHLKILVKFNQQFSSDEHLTDDTLQSIKDDVHNIFDIESKIDFFSDSPTAYKLNLNDSQSIRLELKELEPILVPPIAHLNTSNVCIQNQGKSFEKWTLNYNR